MIRRAIKTDAPAIMAMGRALAMESPRYQNMKFDEAKLMALFDRMLGTLLSEDACIFVSEISGEVVGMMVGFISTRFFSDEQFVTDLTLYVKPEHRGGTSFARLVKAVENWAASHGIYDLVFGVSTQIHPEKTVRAYERMGYTLAGYTMVKHGD